LVFYGYDLYIYIQEYKEIGCGLFDWSLTQSSLAVSQPPSLDFGFSFALSLFLGGYIREE